MAQRCQHNLQLAGRGTFMSQSVSSFLPVANPYLVNGHYPLTHYDMPRPTSSVIPSSEDASRLI